MVGGVEFRWRSEGKGLGIELAEKTEGDFA
jgi:hypothetical protein